MILRIFMSFSCFFIFTVDYLLQKTYNKYITLCKKCKKIIPNKVIINDKPKYLYKRIYCLECSPFGINNRKHLEKWTNTEKTCSKCLLLKKYSDFYFNKKENRLYRYCKQCSKQYDKNKIAKFKQLCLEYLGSKCNSCGYDKCQASLDFHHENPNIKKFNINQKKQMKLTDVIKKELDKCIILCSNCHRELHYLNNFVGNRTQI